MIAITTALIILTVIMFVIVNTNSSKYGNNSNKALGLGTRTLRVWASCLMLLNSEGIGIRTWDI